MKFNIHLKSLNWIYFPGVLESREMAVLIMWHSDNSQSNYHWVSEVICIDLTWSKVLRSLKHCPQVQSQGQHAIVHLEKKGIQSRSGWQSTLKGQDSTTVNQTNTGTVSRVPLGSVWEMGWSMALLSALIPFWMELNWKDHWVGKGEHFACTHPFLLPFLVCKVSPTI